MNPFFSGSTDDSAPHIRARPGLRLQRVARALVLAAGLSLAAPVLAQSVDANTASIDQLETIKGIGPRTAEQIVSERERAGPYRSMQDFEERVRGIGPRRAQALQAAGLVISSLAAADSAAIRPARETRK